jgi:threonine synthase
VRTLHQFDGVVEQATEAELAQAAAKADLAGLFCDPHTGVALAVLEKLVADRTIAPSDRIVVISTANGLKFPDFKIRYHEGKLAGIQSTHANRPIELAASFEAVQRAVFAKLA